MFANIQDLSAHIKQILEFNATALKEVEEAELRTLQNKLEYISNIQKHLIQIRRNSSLDTPEAEQEQDTPATPSGIHISPGIKVVPLNTNPLSIVCPQDSKSLAEESIINGNGDNTERFSDSPHYGAPLQDSSSSSDNPSDPVPDVRELIFSKALTRSLEKDKRNGSIPPLSPTSAASTVVSIDNRVEDLIDSICDDCVKPIAPDTMQSPQTQYRTISLSTSSPRG